MTNERMDAMVDRLAESRRSSAIGVGRLAWLLGVDPSVLAGWEAHRQRPSADVLHLWALLLGERVPAGVGAS